jgi:hypothetical protein
MLDLSAAFDTVDHEILLNRLERKFGIWSTALTWFKSYLSLRTFCVSLHGKLSNKHYLVCSVPQGSVLGPLLFILYTATVADIAAVYGVNVHAYADDVQLYLHCRPSLVNTHSVENLEKFIAAMIGCPRTD